MQKLQPITSSWNQQPQVSSWRQPCLLLIQQHLRKLANVCGFGRLKETFGEPPSSVKVRVSTRVMMVLIMKGIPSSQKSLSRCSAALWRRESSFDSSVYIWLKRTCTYSAVCDDVLGSKIFQYEIVAMRSWFRFFENELARNVQSEVTKCTCYVVHEVLKYFCKEFRKS